MNIDDFDFGSDFDFDFDDLPDNESIYPAFFLKWDKAVKNEQNPGYFELFEMEEIIEIYAIDDDMYRVWEAIDYMLKLYPDNEDSLYYILDTFSDFKLWSDLLRLVNRYKDKTNSEIARHKIDALLHLGMEEEAFLFFKDMKSKFSHDRNAQYTLYYTMGEGLFDMGLYEATIHVAQEAIDILGDELDLYWLQIDSYAQLQNSEKVISLIDNVTASLPFDGDVWYKTGCALYDVGEYERAIQAFEFAENLNVADRKANLAAMIKTYERNGNTHKALEKVKEFLYLYPEEHAVNLLATSLAAELRDWDEAIKFLNNVIKREPANQMFYLYKSSYYINMGEYKKAKLTLEEGISRSTKPNNQLIEQLDKLNNQYPDI